MKRQLAVLKASLGTRLALDHSYKSVAALTAATEGVLSRSGARKLGSFHASVATATAEGGYALAAVIAPNDSHNLILAVLCGLHGAELPPEVANDEYLKLVRGDIASTGTVGHFPVVICTDDSTKDTNLWRRVSKEILGAWTCREENIYSPWGKHSSAVH
jgi:hypothetical protein